MMTDLCLIPGAWRQVIDRVQDARAANRLKQLSYGGNVKFYCPVENYVNTRVHGPSRNLVTFDPCAFYNPCDFSEKLLQ